MRDIVFLTESGGLFDSIGTEKEEVRALYVTEFTVGTGVQALLRMLLLLEGRQVGWTKSMGNLESDKQNSDYNP